MNILYPNEQELIQWRRCIHKHAEPGFAEFWTTNFILEQIQGLNLNIILGKNAIDTNLLLGYPSQEFLDSWKEKAYANGVSLANIDMLENITGLIVDIWPSKIDNKQKVPTILFRFDIDAVQVNEAENISHKPFLLGFSSINKDVCHSCGHDGHIAIGIGLIKALVSIREQLVNGVRIIFQPAEEGVRGAVAFKKYCKGIKYAIIGHIGMKAHNNHELVCGVKGFFATTKFDVNFIGASSHAGGEPEKGKNSLLAASNCAINLHAISRDGRGESRINVGVLKAGTGRNVVPDQAYLSCESRGATSDINESIFEKAQNIIEGCAKMYEQEYKINIVGKCDSAVSDTELIEKIYNVAQSIPYFHNEKIKKMEIGYGSDDACTLMHEVQKQGGLASYIMLGSNLAAGHHDSYFDFDESILKPAVELFTQLAYQLN